MRSQKIKKIGVAAAVAIVALFTVTSARAQGTGASSGTQGALNNSLTQMNADQQIDQIQEKDLGDPKAASAYDSFLKAKSVDKKIKLGRDFINRYPDDYRAQGVYELLAQAYYSKRDLPNFYSCMDRGITLYPKDATLLSLAGWVIPHEYQQNDPDKDKKLEKAEIYEKRALGALTTMTAPRGMSDEQFAAYKKQVTALAHGGLGLIYFRQAKFEDSMTEMQTATADAANPDPTDYLVLGADYQNLNRFKDAADAFNRCAQISGPLQAGCKQYADSSTKQAADAK
jgi:tetratricopeptide (TPR) repeat protein